LQVGIPPSREGSVALARSEVGRRWEELDWSLTATATVGL
jgi:hypothetical protein